MFTVLFPVVQELRALKPDDSVGLVCLLWSLFLQQHRGSRFSWRSAGLEKCHLIWTALYSASNVSVTFIYYVPHVSIKPKVWIIYYNSHYLQQRWTNPDPPTKTNKQSKQKQVSLTQRSHELKLQAPGVRRFLFPLIFLYQQKQSLWAMDDASCVVHGELNKTAGVEH